MRLALLTEIPAPYRIPLFNAMAGRGDVDFRVLFLARADPRHSFYELHEDEWRFDHRFLRGRSLRRGGRWVVLNRGVLRELSRFQPDVVGVGGWNEPAFWQALAYCKSQRLPLLVWIESTARDVRSEALPLQFARRAMIRGAAGAFVPGSASSEYARALGVPADRIALAPNAVESALYAEAAAVDRGGREACTFLYAGRLDPEKGLDTLLRAFARVPGELMLAGSGSDAERLRAMAPERVRFLGPLGRQALAEAYAEADVFVLPSRSEPWGMVLNEAAEAGLPLVATAEVGAARDLIEDGVNGFVVRAEDDAALAAALKRLADDPELRSSAGARSRELSARFTPEAWAEGLAELARRVADEGVVE